MTRTRQGFARRRTEAWAVAQAARAAIADHPRHLVLMAVVAGLLMGPVWPPGVLAVALLALALGGGAGLSLVATAAVLGGAALADVRLAALDAGPALGLTGRFVASDAVLLESVRVRPTGMRAARVKLLAGRTAGMVVAARVTPRAPWPAEARVGDVLALKGRIVPLAWYEAYQRRRGAGAALAVARAQATGRRRGGLAGVLDRTRQTAERSLGTHVPGAEAGMLRGMVLGQDEGIDEPVREEFRRSGLAHLLAASGQNVTLLAVLAIAAATALGAGLRVRLAAALVLVALYVPLAGGGPSIQRAGVMGAAGLVAALAGRPASRWYAVGLAAVVTLGVNPRAAGEPGWQLSFAAVLALVLLAPPLGAAFCRQGCPRALADAAAITIAATAGTAPLMALHFGAVSLASLPANLLVAPAVAPVMWLGMLAATVGQVSSRAAAPLSGLAAYPAAYVEWIAHVAAGFRSASVGVKVSSLPVVALAYVAMGGFAIAVRSALRRSGRVPRRRLRAGLALVGLSLALGATIVATRLRPPPRARGELMVSFLEVGQGDATLLQRDDTAVLVDTGPPGGPILERLREAGVHDLDALVLTHAQDDHEGMAPAVLRAHPTQLVLNGGAGGATPVQRSLPMLAARARARVLVPFAGEVVRFGTLRMRVLWPPAIAPGTPAAVSDPNLRAVVADVRLGDFDLLLTADAESDVTAALALPEVDALKVAHHGSTDDGLAAELARLKPKLAAIEVGARNPYGHPTRQALRALRAVPRVVRTDRDGTVRLRVSGGRMRVDQTRVGVN